MKVNKGRVAGNAWDGKKTMELILRLNDRRAAQRAFFCHCLYKLFASLCVPDYPPPKKNGSGWVVTA